MGDKPTNRIDYDNPAANMYGVLPCPKCGSRYRVPTQPVHPEHPSSILCDDCGFAEKLPEEVADGGFLRQEPEVADGDVFRKVPEVADDRDRMAGE